MLGLTAGVGCRERGASGGDEPSGARLEASWTGADTAAFRASATAEWCDSLGVLTIVATSGDTGIGLALRPGAGQPSAKAGGYPVQAPDAIGRAPAPAARADASPARADSTMPWAAIGLRWFSKTAVQGFQGDSGEVSLARSGDGELSGRFTARAHAYNGTATLSVTGTFDGLRPRAATRGCTPPPPVPSGAAEPGSSGDPDPAEELGDGVD